MTISQRIPDSRSIAFDPGSVNQSETGRVEVILSPVLLASVRTATDALVRQQGHPEPRTDNIEKHLAEMRRQYQEVCTQLVHRIRTDLAPQEVALLHFATIKGVMTTVRDGIRQYIEHRRQYAHELKLQGSGEMLRVQEHLAWLCANGDLLHYRIMKPILMELRRVEQRHLQTLREKTLDSVFDTGAMLFNPLMAVANIPTEQHLFDHLFICDDFTFRLRSLMEEIEDCCARAFPEHEIIPLFGEDVASRTLEGDVSGPVWNSFLTGSNGGPHQRSILERFSWLDDPASVETLFAGPGAADDGTQHRFNPFSRLRRAGSRMVDRWQCMRLRRELSRILRRYGVLEAMLATEQTRRLWPSRTGKQLAYRDLWRFLNGSMPFKRLNALLQHHDRSADDLNTLREARTELRRDLRKSADQHTVEALKLLAGFRQQLKNSRFSQRMFSRIDLIGQPQNDASTWPVRHVYEILTAGEVRSSNRNPVAHECSLTVNLNNIDALSLALRERDIEPAPFLRSRFFDTIEQQIRAHGAEVQERSQSAWQLCFAEYEKIPEQWYSVSHATSLAQKLQECTEKFNRHCHQSDMPAMGCHIEITYRDLSDGKRATGGMTSPTPSLMTEDLATSMKNALNDNGVILCPAAFSKLQQEVMLKQITRKLKDRSEVVYAGSMKLAKQPRTDFLLRETQRRPQHESTDASQLYYELLKEDRMSLSSLRDRFFRKREAVQA